MVSVLVLAVMPVLVPAGTCLGSLKVSLYNCKLTVRSNLDTILHLIVYLLTFKMLSFIIYIPVGYPSYLCPMVGYPVSG